MSLVRGVSLAFVLAISLAPLPLSAQHLTPGGTATCDPSQLDDGSYRLTTEAQAANVLRRSPRVNEESIRLAEEARRLDDGNLMAHGLLARHYITEAVDARKAEEAWRRVLVNGGAITWTATLYDVDPRSLFVVAFDDTRIRLYRFGELAGPVRTQYGVPEFPGPDRTDFWRALGGCIPASARPEVEIPWADVREIEATDWAVRLRLKQKVTVVSDLDNRRTADRLDLHLHRRIGDFDYRYGMLPYSRPYWGRPFVGRPGGVEQTHYELRVKQMLETFFRP